jgi:hypothetical protein
MTGTVRHSDLKLLPPMGGGGCDLISLESRPPKEYIRTTETELAGSVCELHWVAREAQVDFANGVRRHRGTIAAWAS